MKKYTPTEDLYLQIFYRSSYECHSKTSKPLHEKGGLGK